MTGIERFNSIIEGKSPDRPPFVPSVYEHGAALIGKSPKETSCDSKLMAEAALEAYDLYQHDLVTVGIDVYNVEAEAFGCEISHPIDNSIPGIISHPLTEEKLLNPEKISIPKVNGTNRLQLIAEAAKYVVDEIGNEVWVYGCMCGPFSQAVELRGFENLIIDITLRPEMVIRLMEKTTALCIQQGRLISKQGCGIYMSESWATLPLISPDIFVQLVVPYHKKIISYIQNEFNTPPPAVIIGGDTSVLVDYLLEVGSAYMVADFNTDFDYIKLKIKDHNMIVRGCVDTKLIEWGKWKDLEKSIDTLAIKSQGMINFIWGCGCVSYNTPKEHLLKFKEMCLKKIR